MINKDVIKGLEVIADFLENEGFVRESYNIDVILNTLDLDSKGGSKSESKLPKVYDMVSSVLINIVENIQKVNESNPEELHKVNTKFSKMLKEVKPLVTAIQGNSAESKQKMHDLMALLK